MSDTIIVSAIEIIVLAIALVKPIINLTTSIAKLDTTLEMFKDEYERNHANLEQRVDGHDEDIEDLKIKTENHETRLNRVEGGR